MAVSKRLRFEILRRDNHTCQYCGEKAPDVTLHVDHVIPVTLGGSDQPGNLVAACKDCNSGKSSAQLDGPAVEGLNSRAAAYAIDLTDRMTRVRGRIQAEDEFLEEFEDSWNRWSRGDKRVPLPADYRPAIHRFARMGIPSELICRAIDIAMTKEGLSGLGVEFRYMCGVVWRTLDEADVAAGLTPESIAVYTQLEHEDAMVDERIAAYEQGYNKALEDMEVK